MGYSLIPRYETSSASFDAVSQDELFYQTSTASPKSVAPRCILRFIYANEESNIV